MEIKEIRQLVKLVEDANITEIEIVEEGKKLRILKYNKNSAESVVMSTAPMISYQGPPVATAGFAPPPVTTESTPAESASIQTETATSNYTEVRSPMVGTFYRSPAPDADPYVEIGKNVEEGQTLCIIEAMKLMNEIESDYTGKIVKVLVENAQPVEYNQVLFLIEK